MLSLDTDDEGDVSGVCVTLTTSLSPAYRCYLCFEVEDFPAVIVTGLVAYSSRWFALAENPMQSAGG